MELIEENNIFNDIVNLIKTNFACLSFIIFILYVLSFYQLLLHSLIFMLCITLFPKYIINLKSIIIDFIYNTFTDYLGNCSFDALPKTKN